MLKKESHTSPARLAAKLGPDSLFNSRGEAASASPCPGPSKIPTNLTLAVAPGDTR